MEKQNKIVAWRDADGNSRHGLTPATLLKDSGKAVGVGALTGAFAGAVAGAVAGAAVWSMWILGRETVRAIRERSRQ